MWRVRIVDDGTKWAVSCPCHKCRKLFEVDAPVVIYYGEPNDEVYCAKCGEEEMQGAIKEIQDEINKLPAKLF